MSKPECTPFADCFNCPYPDCIRKNGPMTKIEKTAYDAAKLPLRSKGVTLAEDFKYRIKHC